MEHSDKREPSFSLHDFRDWLRNQGNSSGIVLGDSSHNPLAVGNQVLVRLSESNMMSKIAPINHGVGRDRLREICAYLKKYGGVMMEIRGANATLRVLGMPDKDKVEVGVQRLFRRRPKK